jgi:HPt (histidine-containing phosphotransfer) domain-containing protein
MRKEIKAGTGGPAVCAARVGILSGQLESLRGRLCERLRRDRAEITRLHGDRSDPPTSSNGIRLMRLAHGLHGVSGSFGYLELGASAAALETALREAIASAAGWDSERIERLVAALLRELDSVVGEGRD